MAYQTTSRCPHCGCTLAEVGLGVYRHTVWMSIPDARTKVYRACPYWGEDLTPGKPNRLFVPGRDSLLAEALLDEA